MQTRDLTDNVCVITGASSGIGEATARALVAENAQVVLVARSADKIEALAEEPGAVAVLHESAPSAVLRQDEA